MTEESYEEKIEGNPHYSMGDIECIDYLAAQGIAKDFILGNIIKYATRIRHEDQEKAAKDITKIIHYCELYLKYVMN